MGILNIQERKGFSYDDFKNGSYIKMKKTNGFTNEKMVPPLFVTGEEFIG